MEKMMYLSIDELVPFKDNPFKVNEDVNFAMLVDSIKEYGVMTPLTVRPDEGGKFEIISGHRRWLACMYAGVTELPVLVREMDRDSAAIFLVDSNIQREDLKPSEKAFAYKLKLDAMKRQGRRTDLSCPQHGDKSDGRKSVEKIAELSEDSKSQIQRYIRLTNLIPELIQMVDEKRIAFTPAVELSFLKKTEQKSLLECIEMNDATPSLSQAQRLKRLSGEGRLDEERLFDVMDEPKGNQREVIKLPVDSVRRFFRADVSYSEMEQTIIKALEFYRKMQRNRSRQREQER